MPQPLLKVLPGCKTYALDAESLYKHRPALAALVSGAIARWALVEQRMGWLLVRILGADAKPALEMFLAISNTVAQSDALKAAARSVLQGDDLECFEAAMKVVASQAKNRHKLAHWLWGYTPELDDALLLADPVDVLRCQIEQERYDKDPHKWFRETGYSEAQLRQMLGFDNAILVYRKSDLERIIRDFDEASEIAFDFGRMIERQTPKHAPYYASGYPRSVCSMKPHPGYSRLRKIINKLSRNGFRDCRGGNDYLVRLMLRISRAWITVRQVYNFPRKGGGDTCLS